MASDLSRLGRKIDGLADDIQGKAMRQALGKVGREGKRIGDTEIRRDAGGDTALSNWRRGKPINAATRYDHKGDSALLIGPRGRGGGVVRVPNDGRQPGVSRKGRPYPGSTGKGTWARASKTMERELPDVVKKAVNTALRKRFGG